MKSTCLQRCLQRMTDHRGGHQDPLQSREGLRKARRMRRGGPRASVCVWHEPRHGGIEA